MPRDHHMLLRRQSEAARTWPILEGMPRRQGSKKAGGLEGHLHSIMRPAAGPGKVMGNCCGRRAGGDQDAALP
jgi:hypothetical protein